MDKNSVQNQELATVLRKTDGAISHLITGRTKTVDHETSTAIAKLLGTPEDFWSELKASEREHPERPAEYYLRTLGLNAGFDLMPGIVVDHQLRVLIEKWADCPEAEYTDDTLILAPFENARLRATAYDTQIGGIWDGLPRNSRPKMLKPGSHLTIKPGLTKFVHTLEHFRMPRDMVGRVGPTIDLLSSGLIVSHGPLIAPAYVGKLTVGVHNFTEETVTVSSDVRFIKVVFEKLQSKPEDQKPKLGLDADYDPQFLLEEEERLKAELETVRRARGTSG
ncbi:MAG: hypothetical protein GKR98_15460 [Boseongicola sp.]|nr:MAG: hypothetical protein GKR98_15460 [Boseongicola sp.]